MRPEVRSAHPEEIGDLAEIMRAAGMGANVDSLLRFAIRSRAGDVFVATWGGRVVGGVAVLSFATTGWVGRLAVSAQMRRLGIGTALTERCTTRLRTMGARTILLHATAAGHPIYEHAGFETEGRMRVWRDTAPPSQETLDDHVRAIRRGDLSAVRKLDLAATSENRAPVFDALDGRLAGLVAERNGHVVGSALHSPWGPGPSVVVSDGEAGLRLLAALRNRHGTPLTLTLPDANTAAVRALEAWDFQVINEAIRMRLGARAMFEPARIFGMFNLFWG
jgi:predicted N-acetyltransferase YhbS